MNVIMYIFKNSITTQFRRITNDNCSNNRKLPDELAKKVVTLSCKSSADSGVCNVFLVGTLHQKQKYCDLTRRVVRVLKPEAVFLERSHEQGVDMIKSPDSGCEFFVAYDEARKYGGKVFLGDVSHKIWLRRLWNEFSVFKLVAWSFYNASSLSDRLASLNGSIKRLKIKDADYVDVDGIATMTQEASKICPTIMEILLHERDRYMSSRLLDVSSMHNSVVAVVGMYHLPGIIMHWKQSIQARELSDTSGQKPVDPVS